MPEPEPLTAEPDYERESDTPCPYLIRSLWECGATTLEQGWHYSYNRTDRRLVCLDEGHITELEHDAALAAEGGEV